MMPMRTTTRAQNRARYITAERQHNHDDRVGPQLADSPARVVRVNEPDDPPPF
jgi:hypothetical protein